MQVSGILENSINMTSGEKRTIDSVSLVVVIKYVCCMSISCLFVCFCFVFVFVCCCFVFVWGFLMFVFVCGFWGVFLGGKLLGGFMWLFGVFLWGRRVASGFFHNLLQVDN